MSIDSATGSGALRPLDESLSTEVQAFVRSLGGDYALNTVLAWGAISQAARKAYGCQLGPSSPLVQPSLYLMVCAPPTHGKSHGTDRIFAPNYALEQLTVERQNIIRDRSAEEIERRQWELGDWNEKAKKAKGDRRYRQQVARHRGRIRRQIEEYRKKSSWNGRSILTDTTRAALLTALADSPDEYASLISGDGRKLASDLLERGQSPSGRGIRDILLNGFCGDELRVVRDNGVRHRELEHPRLTTVIAVQSDLGQRLLASREFQNSGLGSRFLTFFFEKLDSAHQEPDPASAATWKKLITSIANGKDELQDRIRIEVDPRAAAGLRSGLEFFREMGTGEQVGSPRAEFWARAGDQLQRLCLVRALMETRAGERPVITREVVKAAGLFHHHAWAHLRKGLARANRPSVPTEDVEKLRQAIKDAGGEFPVDPKYRTPAMLTFSKAKIETIAALAPKEFTIRRTEPKGGKRKRGRPMEVVAFA